MSAGRAEESVWLRYRSSEHWLDVFRTYYGPVHKAFAALDADGQSALEADLSHLGAIYGWMIGDFETAKEAARVELQAVGISSGAGRIAIDLGAGPGAHAIVLAE